MEGYARDCFGSAGDRAGAGDLVGVELEFLVFDRTDVTRHVRLARVEEALPACRAGAG
nr:hypothetical protein GCM10020093_012170 [Planobispora longispora]